MGPGNSFADWQQLYASKQIATFPIHPDKKPAIRGWHKVGLRGSRELAAKFTDANAFGFLTGKRSGVTIVDIDTTDERVTADSMARHGDPIIITRTASGKRHLLYRYAGERRRIRPWPGLDIDVLGDGGFAVAPPSILERGSYEIIQGHFDDLDRLRPAKSLDDLKRERPDLNIVTGGKVEEGHRNTNLWRTCMTQAKRCNTFDDLLSFARSYNEDNMAPHLSDSEVIAIANSAWRYEEAGMNSFGGPRTLAVPEERVFQALCTARAGSDALMLYLHLQGQHFWRNEFILSQAYAKTLRWTFPRFRKARDTLVKANVLKVISRGGRGPHDPPVYAWVFPKRTVVKAA